MDHIYSEALHRCRDSFGGEYLYHPEKIVPKSLDKSCNTWVVEGISMMEKFKLQPKWYTYNFMIPLFVSQNSP